MAAAKASDPLLSALRILPAAATTEGCEAAGGYSSGSVATVLWLWPANALTTGAAKGC